MLADDKTHRHLGGGGLCRAIPRRIGCARDGRARRDQGRGWMDRWGCAFMARTMRAVHWRISAHERWPLWSRGCAVATFAVLAMLARLLVSIFYVGE